MTARTAPESDEFPIDPDIFPVHRGRRRRGNVPVLIAISLGGGIGSTARYLAGQVLPGGEHFPWATLIINVAGSLLLGALMVFIIEVWPPSRYLRPFVCIGLIGGFTTFSSCVFEVTQLAESGAWALADGYAAGSLLAGLAAVWCGVVTARLFAGTRDGRGRGRVARG